MDLSGKKEVLSSSSTSSPQFAPIKTMQKVFQKDESQLEKDLKYKGNLILTISIISMIIVITSVAVILINSSRDTRSKILLQQASNLCPKANDVERDWCYLDYTKKHRLNYCNYIRNYELKNYCFGFIENDKKFCADIKNVLIRDACFISLAIENDDKTLCLSTSKKFYCEKEVEDKAERP